MSNTPSSWEEAVVDGDELLTKQTQEQLNIQQQQRGNFRPNFNSPSFNPGAPTFQPGAPAFTPGHTQIYGGPRPGGYEYSQNGYGVYPQKHLPYTQPESQYHQQYPQQYPQQFYPQYHSQYHPQYSQPQQYQQQTHAPPVSTQKLPQDISATSSPNLTQHRAHMGAAPVSQAAHSANQTPTPPPSVGASKVINISGSSSSPMLAPTKKSEKPIANTVITIGGSSERPEAKPAQVLNISIKSTTPNKSSSPAPSVVEKAAQKREADAVLKEMEEAVDDAVIEELYGKEHVNLIFIGHVDAGKSSLGGSILYATGMVDERTMEKYKQEAKAQGTETWYLSWALDLTKEERAKGKTVEVGRAYFETEKRRYTILDAPGHKTFVPNMIGGASQADIGILVISARKGEYETGFERGGQTREHAVLAKTQGVNKLIVVVNKMDDPTVEWSQERYDECTGKLTQFLRATGYNPKTDLCFMPLSALTGLGLKDRVPKNICSWYDGPSLLEYLDSMKALDRKVKAPFMMPIAGKYRDMGTVIEGKIESGYVKKGSNILMMPGKTLVEVLAVYSETEMEIFGATCGDQIRLRVKGVEEEDVMPGYVMTSPKRPVHCVTAFEAQIRIIDLKSILTSGFQCVLHVHTTVQEVTFAALLHKLEKGTGRKSKKPPAYASKGQAIIARLEATTPVPIERYEDYQQLGRFTLRDQGQTIAIGKVTRLITDTSSV